MGYVVLKADDIIPTVYDLIVMASGNKRNTQENVFKAQKTTHIHVMRNEKVLLTAASQSMLYLSMVHGYRTTASRNVFRRHVSI